MLTGKVTKQIIDEVNNIPPKTSSSSYAELLATYGLDYTTQRYYLLVGEVTQVQGWILHISVVISQAEELIKLLIPELIAENVPFKIPTSANTAERLLGGTLGYINVGKLISIYPENDTKAVTLVQKLIQLTAAFKGPAIPTDVHLGAVVYTRYGGFNPIVKMGTDGNSHKLIYDCRGQLKEDECLIPFVMPEGIPWPFTAIKGYSAPATKKFLNDCIKPVIVIKPDVKGNVIKGMYLKNWFRPKYCIIKEGKKNMCSDKAGRDMQDRIKWQLQLHRELANKIPIPKALDCFKEDEDLYLVMEFIDGVSLDKKIMGIYEGNSWRDLLLNKQLQLLDYLLEVLHIVQTLHQEKYVHRDIAPDNFIVDKKNRLHVIDLEVTYSVVLQYPNPSFGAGTYGFIPPEQEKGEVPTVKEDIYQLGALMIVVFTCLQPVKLELAREEELRGNLLFFVGDPVIANIITDCLQLQALHRPELTHVIETIYHYRKALAQGARTQILPTNTGVNTDEINQAIHEGLHGIVSEMMLFKSGIWASKTQDVIQMVANPQTSHATYPGFYVGVTGILFALSQIKRAGIDIPPAVEACYQTNLAYIQNTYENAWEEMPAGLCNGSAGTAMMIASGINCGLIAKTESNLEFMLACLDRDIPGFDFLNGAAGQGLAVLQCASYLKKDFADEKIQRLTEFLSAHQEKNGTWNIAITDKGKKISMSGLSYGTSGIICFLLAATRYNYNTAQFTVAKALNGLIKDAHKQGNTYLWHMDSVTKQVDKYVHNGITGTALSFIRAYELLQEPIYKTMAEGALSYFSPHIMDRSIGHALGITGLGEVYLEAWRVFKDDRWKQQADWITNSLIHFKKRLNTVAGYWVTGPADITPTADFMTGNSGIIHFLARNLQPTRLQYPVFSELV